MLVNHKSGELHVLAFQFLSLVQGQSILFVSLLFERDFWAASSIFTVMANVSWPHSSLLKVSAVAMLGNFMTVTGQSSNSTFSMSLSQITI